jgi:hypothetical protein
MTNQNTTGNFNKVIPNGSITLYVQSPADAYNLAGDITAHI